MGKRGTSSLVRTLPSSFRSSAVTANPQGEIWPFTPQVAPRVPQPKPSTSAPAYETTDVQIAMDRRTTARDIFKQSGTNAIASLQLRYETTLKHRVPELYSKSHIYLEDLVFELDYLSCATQEHLFNYAVLAQFVSRSVHDKLFPFLLRR